MTRDDMPLDQLTHVELLREIAGNLRYLRRVLSEFEPLLTAIKGSGNGDVIRAAGLRRALRKGTGNAVTSGRR